MFDGCAMLDPVGECPEKLLMCWCYCVWVCII